MANTEIMSVLGKKWIIKNSDESKNTFDKILENRGLLDDDKEEKTLHDPFLFKDMNRVIARIKEAIDKKERVVVFGDYDVDGITGTAILVHVLKKLGANVSYRLPHRVDDGYGLSEKFIDELTGLDVKLLITTDCGISCEKEIAKAAKQGMETIVTDHHTIPEKGVPSKAIGILHPKDPKSQYPFKGLTGAGVALKLAQALMPAEESFSPLIDLAALGTVADLGSLKGENWYIVKKGLENLMNTKWVGLKKIMELADIKEMSSSSIGYRIAPRINAAGRIGNPYLALSLLLQEEVSEKVNKLGDELEALNTKRKEMTFEAQNQAELLIDKNNLPYIIMVESPDWHVGIIGLIAGRMAEKYMRPSIIMQDFGDTLVASARSRDSFDIIEAITKHKDLLISFGGHAQAAGFNLKKANLQKFKRAIEKEAKAKLKNKNLKPTLEIDCRIDSKEISMNFIKELNKLSPFGIGNTQPVFILSGIEPQFIQQVGKEKQHLKFSTRINDKEISTIAFRMGEFADEMRRHRKIDVVFHLEKNVWRYKEQLQLQMLDFRKTSD
ncbi:MAG: single-stranded-DNA-specific exonuclease RecJ [Nitrospirae bacterium]|nr:single-stranded-DNA-specific exonuclease RecJ [Nitrospirota bacterium]